MPDDSTQPKTALDLLARLVESAKPFTSDHVVTVTSGTIRLMDALEEAIAAAEEYLAVFAAK